MNLKNIFASMYIFLFLTGCAVSPKTGDITHARVNFVVGEWLYKKVILEDQSELLNNPHRTQNIRDAINSGVSIEDVRDGKLLLCSCRYGSNSGASFIVLLPKEVTLPLGDRVELEIMAGIPSYEGHPGTLSKFLSILPARTVGRTDCFPSKQE